MLVIGLTGSIAMGKSEAAKILAAKGLLVFDADAEVHKLYDSEEGAAIIRPFVPEAARGGKVDRKIITEHVLKDPALLTRLEKGVHAEIRRRRQGFIDRARASGAKAVVLDIPLLFETGSEKNVDKTIVISSTPELQRARALERGLTEERLALILARQMPDADKRKRADAVVFNNSTLMEMKKQLLAFLSDWKVKI